MDQSQTELIRVGLPVTVAIDGLSPEDLARNARTVALSASPFEIIGIDAVLAG